MEVTADPGIVNSGAASTSTSTTKTLSHSRLFWIKPPCSYNTGNGCVKDIVQDLVGPEKTQKHTEGDKVAPGGHVANWFAGFVNAAVPGPRRRKMDELGYSTRPKQHPNVGFYGNHIRQNPQAVVVLDG
mmetsp:Transcript_9260/g.22494  ORF Transcript_9260/g.22494 Transcript_9260/m.22494 type:complete len:129 (+) Transcript_9260:713-1099(+)